MKNNTTLEEINKALSEYNGAYHLKIDYNITHIHIILTLQYNKEPSIGMTIKANNMKIQTNTKLEPENNIYKQIQEILAPYIYDEYQVKIRQDPEEEETRIILVIPNVNANREPIDTLYTMITDSLLDSPVTVDLNMSVL